MNRTDYLNGGAYLTAKRGTELPGAKLDEDKVRWCRRNPDGLTQREKARVLGVSQVLVEKVDAYERCGHVT